MNHTSWWTNGSLTIPPPPTCNWIEFLTLLIYNLVSQSNHNMFTIIRSQNSLNAKLYQKIIVLWLKLLMCIMRKHKNTNQKSIKCIRYHNLIWDLHKQVDIYCTLRMYQKHNHSEYHKSSETLNYTFGWPLSAILFHSLVWTFFTIDSSFTHISMGAFFSL